MIHHMAELFDATVSRFPDRCAVADPEAAYTFRQLQSLACHISTQIPSDTDKSQPIGVFAYRRVSTLPLFFGVIYFGCGYLPLDPELPGEKLKQIIHENGIKLVLSCNGDLEDIVRDSDAHMIVPNFDADFHVNPASTKRNEDDPLYYISTSGSTGKPKCILKTHKAMASFVHAYVREFAFDENTVIGNQTPFCFDASAKDIYLMVACGATIEILPTSLFTFPIQLIKYMDERKVNFISWVPSALCVVTRMNTFMEIKPRYLKRVFFVGEVFPIRQFLKWKRALPNVEFVNLYGSSELCGIACYCRIIDEPSESVGLPMGGPLSNCEVILVSDGEKITSPNTTGEVYVCSESLALGYCNDPERTKTQFITEDFGDGAKRYYRTGDLARYSENGILYFSSRNDYQVKHMGHRIELGEIETVVSAIVGIDRCCCLYHAKRQRIILYCTLEAGAPITETDLMSILRNRLASYMLPHKIIILSEFPQNANGKIDRAAMVATLK